MKIRKSQLVKIIREVIEEADETTENVHAQVIDIIKSIPNMKERKSFYSDSFIYKGMIKITVDSNDKAVDVGMSVSDDNKNVTIPIKGFKASKAKSDIKKALRNF